VVDDPINAHKLKAIQDLLKKVRDALGAPTNSILISVPYAAKEGTRERDFAIEKGERG
jgi:hypothetical protein